jgi:hypothetical protein
MALLFFEGFDKYSTATQMSQQANYSIGSSPTIVTVTPRTGRACLECWNGGNARFNVAPTGSTLIAGAGIFFPNPPNGSQFPLQFWARNNSRVNIELRTNGSAQLQIRRGSDVLWTGTDTEPTNVWLHYEMKVVFDHTANGAVTLRRNGQVVVALTGVQTKIAASDAIDAIRIAENSGSGQRVRMDDLYICDGSGTANNDFLGQMRVRTLWPDTEVQAEWTPTPPGSNLPRIADTTPDDDTGYVTADVSGLMDLYGVENLPASVATISGLRVSYRMRKQDAAAAQARCLVKSGTQTANGQNDAPDTSYRYFSALFDTDPATNAAWTPSGVNAVQIGFERTL